MLTLSKIIKKDFGFFSGGQTFHEIKILEINLTKKIIIFVKESNKLGLNVYSAQVPHCGIWLKYPLNIDISLDNLYTSINTDKISCLTSTDIYSYV